MEFSKVIELANLSRRNPEFFFYSNPHVCDFKDFLYELLYFIFLDQRGKRHEVLKPSLRGRLHVLDPSMYLEGLFQGGTQRVMNDILEVQITVVTDVRSEIL